MARREGRRAERLEYKKPAVQKRQKLADVTCSPVGIISGKVEA
jgi:hypothetical protein